ncbi:MAG: ribonuclease HI [Chloroflexi bacterium]|nr:ribonuclease HI [Chloroflexota bacterium]
MPAPATALPQVAVYCRACALGVPGPAGYAATLVMPGDKASTVSGGWSLASSNAMELWAAIAGLRSLKQRSKVTLFTSSKYVYDNATKRLVEWEHNRWHTKDGQPVKNQEMWRELAIVLGDHDITWRYMPGDTADEFSQRAARVARQEAERQAGQRTS